MNLKKALKVKEQAEYVSPKDTFIINSDAKGHYQVKKISELMYCHKCKGTRLVRSLVCAECKTAVSEMDRRKWDRRAR